MTEFQDYKNYGDTKDEDVQYFCKLTFGQFFTILVLEVVTLAFIFYLGAKYGTDYLKVSKEEPQMITEYVTGDIPADPDMPEALKDKELQAMARDAVKGGESDLKARVREMLKNGPATETLAGRLPPPEAAPTTTATGLPVQTIQQQAAKTVDSAVPAGRQGQGTGDSGQKNASLDSSPSALGGRAQNDKAPADGGVIKVKSSSVGQYSVQVGSYPKMEEASAKVEDWRKKGYPSFMMIADIPDRGRWYRVRIGGFPSKEEAQAYLDKIKQSESIDGIVVLNEQ